jgi:tetratricopeptide (TPR) repeat protein
MSEERLRGLEESGPRNALSILATLNARGVTGVLRFEPALEPEYVVDFLFREGKLVYATTNRPGARMGEFLVRRNVLSSDQATTALFEAKRQGKLFHGYLAEHGLVERKLLQELLYERTEELLYAVLHTQDGRFVFEHSTLRQYDRLVPTVDADLFARLLTYRNLWSQAYEKLSAYRLILRRVPGIEASPRFDSLSDVERRALELVDGKRPVQRVLDGRWDRVELTLRLAQFLEAGLVEVVAWDSQPAAPSRPLEADKHAAGRPSEAAAQQAAAPAEPLERQEMGSAPIDLEMLPALTPGTELTKIPAAGLTMDDLFVLSQIDGKTSLRQLISITGMAEKPLFRLMHQEIRKGYVELRPRQVLGPPVRSIRTPSPVTATLSRPQTAPPRGAPRPASEPPRPPAPEVILEPKQPAAAEAIPRPKRPMVPPPPSEAARAASAAAERKAEALRLHVRAVTAYTARNFSTAEELLRRALSLDAESSRIRAHLALALAEQPNQMEKAQRMLEKALEDDPLDSLYLEAMGLLKAKLGDYTKAKLLLETAMLLDSKNVPSSARVLEVLKNYQPKRGARPEDVWPMIFKHIRLAAP